jgi:hypothetical protein
VDGRLVGNTPKTKVLLTAGYHRVRIERAGFKTFERDIYVVPGREVRLSNIILGTPIP